ncbi:hypothetical protein [Mycolicibacterium houstonense]|uniref:hypothetical protein n=1 Tax=Mycolicibacterium houstonense TaxID=146021 RepID=UPI00082DA740|nr:hypothetical protein [Mycolicibacterium houstonense]
MNEVQHQAKIARDQAMADYKAAQADADFLGKVLIEADKALREAISRAPDSWYGTPGILQ